MSEDPGHLARRLEQEGEKSRTFFLALADLVWSAPIYSAGSGWRLRDILAHFTSAEHAFHLLVRDVLDGGSGAPRDFDIDRFNEAEVAALHDQAPETMLQAFADARATSVRLTRSMQPGDLARIGRHPWFGETQIGDMLKLIYRHNQLHQRDIRKALSTGTPLPAESSLRPQAMERLEAPDA